MRLKDLLNAFRNDEFLRNAANGENPEVYDLFLTLAKNAAGIKFGVSEDAYIFQPKEGDNTEPGYPAQLPLPFQNSCEISTDSKGQAKLTVKTYGGTIDDATSEAYRAYTETRDQLENSE